MRAILRGILLPVAVLVAALLATGPAAAGARTPPTRVLDAWYRLILELVRHTPSYSPPVASRSFGYLGVTVFEVAASGDAGLRSLAGQLNHMPAMPRREAGTAYDEAVILAAALAFATEHHFSHTGPTGHRAMAALRAKLLAETTPDIPADVVRRSAQYGEEVAAAIFAWSQTDGGADVQNMGFPTDYALKPGPEHWRPTSTIGQQQSPLLPDWGRVRPFAMPDGAACPLPPPPPYSEDPASAFYAQALEVHDTVRDLSDEQRAIARFWSDDPMLSPTPPGHWIAIALQLLDEDNADLPRRAEVLARQGVAAADAFIGCWKAKYTYDLLRPVTYIRRVIDPSWDALLITPPFPEYPSGHSTLSGAEAAVLTAVFGGARAFIDATHARDGLAPRRFDSFHAAAGEAAISRIFGGIHFRAAAENGLDQGHCIARYAIALKMRN